MTEQHAATPGRPIALPLTTARIHAYQRDGITPPITSSGPRLITPSTQPNWGT